MNNMTTITRVGGKYKLAAICAITGRRRDLTGWFPNLVTNAGLDRVCSVYNSDALRYCQVGTGSTAPAATDTQLAQYLATTEDHPTASASGSGAPSYVIWRSYNFRFQPGTATGNISEVGVGWASTGGLFSRALVLDGGGQPTSVTVLASEYLEVAYRFELYPMVDDQTGVLTLDGADYNYTVRPSNIDAFGSGTTPTTTLGRVHLGDPHLWLATAGGNHYVYDGSMGGIEDNPSGSSNVVAVSAGTGADPDGGVYYSGAGTHEVVYFTNWPLHLGNFVSGIGVWRVWAGPVAYQVGFSPKIPKTTSHTLTLNLGITYANHSV